MIDNEKRRGRKRRGQSPSLALCCSNHSVRGRELPYEVIDGMAVHGGDIVLGTVEEAATGRNHKGGANYP